MQDNEASYRTRFFHLRLWQEQHDAGASEWRGQVTCVATGEVRTFRTWMQLVEALASMVDDKQRKNSQG
jgi:hypothetical protein